MTPIELVGRIDAAIERLQENFDKSPVVIAMSICNLREKRARVLDGTYKPDEDAARLRGYFRWIGAGICEAVKAREPWYEPEREERVAVW
jgi:hypothetical protein